MASNIHDIVFFNSCKHFRNIVIGAVRRVFKDQKLEIRQVAKEPAIEDIEKRVSAIEGKLAEIVAMLNI